MVRPVVKISKDKISGKRINVATNSELNFGDEVRIGNEVFYVLKDCSETEQYVEILSKTTIDLYDLEQTYVNWFKATAFSTTNYWAAQTGITYPHDLNTNVMPDENQIALKVAYDYGKKLGGIGRLLTYEEIYNLKDTGIYISLEVQSGTGSERGFWLSTARDDEAVWAVWSGSENFGWDHDIPGYAYGEVYFDLRCTGYGKDLHDVWDEGSLEYIDVTGERYEVLPVIKIDKTKLFYFEF